MKKTLKLFFLVLACFFTVIVFNSCQKEASYEANNGSKQQVAVYLGDDPVHEFVKVNVDIRYVEVKVDTSVGYNEHDNDHDGNDDHDGDDDDDDDHHGSDHYGMWDTLAIHPGVYDLLTLRNGNDTLLANGSVPAGRITKIRFTLGPNNTVWTDSIHSQPLTLCDHQPYVYAKVREDVLDTTNNQVVIRIDLDVKKSIKYGNGTFCLKPQLKLYSGKNTGEIEGKIQPAQARPLIKVFNNTDTAYAVPFENGKYKIKGLKEGSYTINFDALSPYQDTTLTNIQVHRGRETELGIIQFHP